MYRFFLTKIIMTFKNKKTILSILLFWIGISIGFSENKKMYSIEELFQIAENNNSNIKLSELCGKQCLVANHQS